MTTGMMKKKEIKKVLIARTLLLSLIAGAFALGIFIGAGMGLFTPLSTVKSESMSGGGEGTFKFIRDSMDTKDTQGRLTGKDVKPVEDNVKARIDEMLKQGGIADASVYFLDLDTGNGFGIKEHEKFIPVSLLKIPLMIAYFKWAETNPLVLRKMLTYTTAHEAGAEGRVRPEKQLEPGQAYTVNDLIYRMIAYDDLAANALLYAKLPAGRLEKIFQDLNVAYDPHRQENSLSLNVFAAFYRVLFNASYLSEEMSEKALRYLSRSLFRDGMSSGIPPNIDIASRHGERMIPIMEDGEEKELIQVYECGIIYHPNRPFLFGIMVRGADSGKLVTAIRDITHLVYEEVDQQSHRAANIH